MDSIGQSPLVKLFLGLHYTHNVFFHSFIFSNCIIPVRLVVDPQPISGVGNIRLDETRVHHRAPCSHTFTCFFTPRGNLQKPVLVQGCFWKVGGNRRTLGKTIDMGEHARLHTPYENIYSKHVLQWKMMQSKETKQGIGSHPSHF